jgi:four helix bundle protein
MSNGDWKMQNDGQGSTRKGADIEERLLDFAVRVGRAIDALPDTRLGRHIAGQLVRSGTSPAPNYAEACAAESKRDFLHKLAIVLKELRESSVWIRLIVKSELIPEQRLELLREECDQLCKIIAKSLVTAKSSQSRNAKTTEPMIND